MSSEKNETRNRILKAVLILMEEQQGSEVRMTDIAKRSGISRQAVYLHFETRADLLISATRYIDEVNGFGERMAFLREKRSGAEKLDAFVETWGNYIPQIYPIAVALRAMMGKDQAASEAWNNRMQAVREGCEILVSTLQSDGNLNPNHSEEDATNLLWMLLSIENWERLTKECGWRQEKYINQIQELANSALIGG
jgi:AcrR family transcriptional regulator